MQNLLRTKLFIPPMPSEVVPRPRLVKRLNFAVRGKLSLVTAPAGYGKTMLVTTWLHQLRARDTGTQVVWLSLDEGDDDLRRFLTYFVAALCQVDESFEATREVFLQDSRDEIATKAMVASLLNQVVEYGQSVILILDDYHEINSPAIHEALSFWLDHQPPNFHLVITSREEPPLPLPRMRVRRQVTEIGTDALRFSPTESADFLNQHMQLKLSAADIAQLESMTEGWVAGLQLAALSLQNKAEPQAFIESFKGDNRYIVDYLVSEVLSRQADHIRDFLLKTSILPRLNVELCNAVTEQLGSQHILEGLYRARLFVIPLDDRRHWYRYHHLFAECLQAELLRSAPAEVPAYHERASRWFSPHGFLDEAIHHAFAAGNNRLAADLIGANVRVMLSKRGEPHRLWEWIQQLPDETIHTSPRLLLATAWLVLELFSDQEHRINELLDKASTLVYAPDAPYTPSKIADMATEIALIRGSLARLRGDLAQAIEHTERAVTLIQAGESPMLKMGASGSLAVIHYLAGNMAQFLKSSTAQLESLRQNKPVNYAGYVFAFYMIDGLRLHGQLVQAERLFQHLKPSHQQQQSVGRAMIAISWAEVLRERNQLDLAVATLTPAIETLKPLPSKAVVVQTGAITLARILQAQGKGQEALKLLRETRQNFPSTDAYYPSARLLATEALLDLWQGNLSAAKAWVEKSGLKADDEPTYLLEIDYLVLARVLIADGAVQAAQALLGKIAQAATEGGRIARLIKVYILQALAHQALGKPVPALAQLEQAITLGQSAGFVRLFVDEGNALVPLLKQIGGRGVALAYIRQLLPLFDETTPPQPTPTSEQNAASVEPDSVMPLLNPLTKRELATLRYLASNLTTSEIAEQMIVAPSTIRTYVKRIYGKLDVHTRIEAVNRARTLGLIS